MLFHALANLEQSPSAAALLCWLVELTVMQVLKHKSGHAMLQLLPWLPLASFIFVWGVF